MNIDISNTHLPIKPKHYRKTFATETLKKITCRLQYYRKVLNMSQPENPELMKKFIKQRRKIQIKYDHDIKIRNLLNRAIKHLYEK